MPKVLQSIQERDSAYKQFLRNHIIENHLSYKQYRKATHRLICLGKREFFIKIAHQRSRQFWHNIKYCTGMGKLKQFIHPRPYSSTKQMVNSATKLNKFFVNFITKLVPNNRTTYTLPLQSCFNRCTQISFYNNYCH